MTWNTLYKTGHDKFKQSNLTGKSLKEQIEANKLKKTPGPGPSPAPAPVRGGGVDMFAEIQAKIAARNKKKSAEAEGSTNDQNTDNNA